MYKKTKLNLDELSVQSFVTTLDDDQTALVRGATGNVCSLSCGGGCEGNTEDQHCPTADGPCETHGQHGCYQ